MSKAATEEPIEPHHTVTAGGLITNEHISLKKPANKHSRQTPSPLDGVFSRNSTV